MAFGEMADFHGTRITRLANGDPLRVYDEALAAFYETQDAVCCNCGCSKAVDNLEDSLEKLYDD